METQTETAKGNGKSKGASGRQNPDRQEAVIEMQVFRMKLEQLVILKRAVDEASENLNDAVKAVAEKSGLLASVVRKVVVARAGENFDGKRREADQLSLAFDQVA